MRIQECNPPATSMAVPVTYELALEQMNSMAFATSSGRATRCRGVMRTTSCFSVCDRQQAHLVPVMPGRTALTRMPLPSSSWAKDLVKATTPALDAEYAEKPPNPVFATMLETFTMTPSVTLPRSMALTAAWLMRKVPWKKRDNERRQM